MISFERSPSSIAIRVCCGRQWTATRRSSIVARRLVRIGFAPRVPGAEAWANGRANLVVVVSGHKRCPTCEREIAHEARRIPRLLGCGDGRPGAARAGPGGRGARLRLGL